MNRTMIVRVITALLFGLWVGCGQKDDIPTAPVALPKGLKLEPLSPDLRPSAQPFAKGKKGKLTP